MAGGLTGHAGDPGLDVKVTLSRGKRETRFVLSKDILAQLGIQGTVKHLPLFQGKEEFIIRILEIYGIQVGTEHPS